MGPSYGQYCTRIVNGILFHSLPYDKQNPYTLQTSEFNNLEQLVRMVALD